MTKRFESRLPIVLVCLVAALALSACRSTKAAATVAAVPFSFGCPGNSVKNMPVEEAVAAPAPAPIVVAPAPEPEPVVMPEPAPAPAPKRRVLRKQ